MSIAVVVPTIREDCAQKFLAEWRGEFNNIRLIVVEDNPEPTFNLGSGFEHYSWRDIDRDLGENAWIIPRRTSACRSYGLWKAYKGGADIIWTLDDDCYPEDRLRGRYLDLIAQQLWASVDDDSWHNTIADYGVLPRGYPYDIRTASQPVMMHHGLWSEHPDFDGMTQKRLPKFRLKPTLKVERVPTGRMFPMCVMNLAFRRELVPAMYLLLMGQDQDGVRWGFDRFDDIWAGLFIKRICDHLGYAITSGAPSIQHSKASNADTNIKLEACGVVEHERFWRYVRDIPLTGVVVAECYRELADAVSTYGDDPYFGHLGLAMSTWIRILEKAS